MSRWSLTSALLRTPPGSSASSSSRMPVPVARSVLVVWRKRVKMEPDVVKEEPEAPLNLKKSKTEAADAIAESENEEPEVDCTNCPCMCCMVPTEEGMNTRFTAQWGTRLLSECLLRAGVKLPVNFSMIYQMTGDLHSSLPSVAKTMAAVFCQDYASRSF